ncbi:ParA family protein [Rhodococcus sp. 1R11]|nr:ParA family protein [Rhodococcus sp. 1R11]
MNYSKTNGTGERWNVSTPQPPAAESASEPSWGVHPAVTPDTGETHPSHPHSDGALFHTRQPEYSRETRDIIPAPNELGPTGRKTRPVPDPQPLASHGPAKIIAMCNQKGGVGKTTSTINLGASLAGYGRRVLLVDLDPQGALSAGLGVAHHELDLTVYNLLVEAKVSADDIIMRTRVDNLDLMPSNIDLSAAEIQLVTEVGREQTLGRVLHPILDRYDYVLIDCQPSLGLLTVNALTCADEVLIPMECEYFSLRGLALLNDTVEKVRDRLNPRLKLAGIVVTMFDARTLHSREVMTRVVEVFGDVVYDTVITRTVRFPETSVAGEPITTWAPKSGGAQAYRALAREVIYRSGP